MTRAIGDGGMAASMARRGATQWLMGDNDTARDSQLLPGTRLLPESTRSGDARSGSLSGDMMRGRRSSVGSEGIRATPRRGFIHVLGHFFQVPKDWETCFFNLAKN